MNNGFQMPVLDNHPNIKSELNEIVKQEVEETFGHRIVTSRDCIHLSEEIYFKTSFRINSNTLRRFFGLVKAQYPPSVSTLNILANYCGYNSVEEISALRKKTVSMDDDSDKRSFLRYLVTIFTATQVKDVNDETFFSLVKHTINFLSHHPDLAYKFQRAIVKTRNGQEFYFEQFVNVDKLNSFYGEGLRYYLNEWKGQDAQVFGYSLLCLRDWLSGDIIGLKKNFECVKRQGYPKVKQPYIYGRYFAAHLFYADVFKLDTNKIIEEAYKVHSELKRSNANYKLFHSLEYTIAGALILTRHYEDALFYINEAFYNYPEKHSYMDQGCYRRLTLLKALALVHMGNSDEACRLFEQLRPSQFFFLSKKIDTILYLLLASYLKKSNPKLDRQLDELCNGTGFEKLKEIYHNNFAQMHYLSVLNKSEQEIGKA
jgi:tetratricopeptide (TPR) repeat protein